MGSFVSGTGDRTAKLWALEDGRSIVWVQRILGHASAETTLRRYSHWVQPEKADTGFLRLAKGAN